MRSGSPSQHKVERRGRGFLGFLETLGMEEGKKIPEPSVRHHTACAHCRRKLGLGANIPAQIQHLPGISSWERGKKLILEALELPRSLDGGN